MSHDISTNPKHCKVFLLGTSALVCLALSAPVMADDFVITGSNNSTNGTGTKNGGAAADIAANAINGGHTVSLGIALTTTGTNVGIKTTNNNTEAQGNTVTVTGTGSITAEGVRGYGIYNVGAFNTTTVSGRITPGNDDYAHGIVNVGASNTATISGSITTLGTSAHGIVNVGASNTTTISGSITTGGGNATGIYNNGAFNETTVSGSIETGATEASGIRNYGDDNETTLSGSIETEGTNATGIYNNGAFNETTVSGSIETGGTGASGIRNYGDDNKITISGTVKATGAKSAALNNRKGSGNSFTLDEGAIIIGDILARDASGTNFDATNSKLIFNLGASTSYAYSVSGKGEVTSSDSAGRWTFSDLDGRTQGVSILEGADASVCDTTITGAGNDTCNLVTAVGNGNTEAQYELQFGMNSSMIGSLSLGNNTAAPVEVMSFVQTPQSNAWAKIYGGSSKRAVSATQSSFDSSNRGLTIGTPVAINDTLNVDLVFNTSRTSLDIGSTKDQEITANSYNVGAVLRDLAPASGWGVDAYGFVGRNSYDGKRKVMNNQETTGSETVTASYSGTEVLVGVNAQYSQAINETLNFIGGVNASLSNEKIGAYSESKYYSWDARTLTQVAGGVTAGLEYHKDAFTSFATLGLQRSSLQKGKTAGYTNNGTAGSHTDTSGAATYASATVGFNYAADDSMNITGTAGMSRASGGISGSSVSLSANWTF